MLSLTVATATGPRTMFAPMAEKRTRNGKIARDARVRAILEELKATRFKSTAALARALHMEGPTITEFLQEKRGAGLDLLIAVADLTGQSVDALIGRPVRDHATLGGLPQWAAARADAERRLAHLRPEVVTAALDRVGAFGVPDFAIVLTGLFVAKLAEAVVTAPAEY